jgi:threonine/homoserine/homoserine lactone efflux protein
MLPDLANAISNFFLRGLLVGFSIAAPVGPIGVLCIRRTLAEGRLSGFVSGLGAATADAFYGGIAGFGLTLISSILLTQQQSIRLLGGVFLCCVGVKTLLARPAGEGAAVQARGGLSGAYLSTLFLTLTNPMTILSFTAIFAGLGLGAAGGYYPSALALILGVFIGSALWWLILSGGVSLLRGSFGSTRLVWVNRISGLIILSFGLAALISLLAVDKFPGA